MRASSRSLVGRLALAAALLPTLAWSGPRHLSVGGPNYQEFGGDANNLPVSCRLTEADLLGRARGLASVRAAMQVFASRGYVPVTAADTAFNVCRDEAPGSIVTLAYRKPGAWIDSNHVAVPLILVATMLSPETGAAATTVTGGMAVVDGVNGLVFSADSLAAFRASDPSFEMRLVRGGGGGPTRRIGTESVNDDVWRQIVDPNSRFNKYIHCVGWAGIACVMGAIRMGSVGAAPVKIAALLAEPEFGLLLIEACLSIAAISCLKEILF